MRGVLIRPGIGGIREEREGPCSCVLFIAMRQCPRFVRPAGQLHPVGVIEKFECIGTVISITAEPSGAAGIRAGFLQLADCFAGALKRPKGLALRTRIAVVTINGHIDIVGQQFYNLSDQD